MDTKFFGTDGIRGIIGESFTSGFITRIAKATAAYLLSPSVCKAKKVVIGCDTRRSCDFIVNLLSGELASRGIDVINIGIAPTAALSFLTYKLGADLGIMVSASHNNFTYNGIKFFEASGEKLGQESISAIDSLIKKPPQITATDAANVGIITLKPDAINLWQRFLIKKFKPYFNTYLPFVTRNPPTLVIDCANGSGADCAEKVFTRLGFNAVLHNTQYNGININERCGAAYASYMQDTMQKPKLEKQNETNSALFNLSSLFKHKGSSIGFAFDGDADRCVVFDEQGKKVHGDVLLYLLSKFLKEKGELKNNKVIGTILCNLGVEKKLSKEGIALTRTFVGDKYIYEALKKENLSLGGEECGHIIFPDIWVTGDGLLTALMTLVMLKHSGKTLSQLQKEVEIFPQAVKNIQVTAEQKINLFRNKEFKKWLKDYVGLHKDHTIIVRPSGTENIIRVTVEGKSITECEKLKNEIAEKILQTLNPVLAYDK